MHIDIPQRMMLELAKLTPGEQREWLFKCGPEGALLIDAAFEAWHAKGQLEPADASWRVWLMMAGRGFGKTRAGAEWIHQLAMIRPVRIALVGASITEARLVMVEGVSGILSVARRKRQRLKWEPSIGRLTWPRGSVAQLFSGDHADGLRGPEHHFAWCDSGPGCDCRGSRGRPPAGHAAGQPSDRELLHRRGRPERGLDRSRTARRRLHDRGVAVHYAAGRNGLLCRQQRRGRGISWWRMGLRNA